MTDLEKLCKEAHEARLKVGTLDTDIKNNVLMTAADNLMNYEKEILEANEIDINAAREKGVKESMIDRLSLNHDRLSQMADGLRQIAKLNDPIGEVMSMSKRPNGLIIGKRRVAIGVIGMIFEARPNVTSDAFGLCFKTGNCVILKGGSDALNTNKVIVDALGQSLLAYDVPRAALSLIESTDRETTNQFMKMNKYVDVLIPRGGAGLINNVVMNSTVPVIQTGTGNCHVYVDKDAKREEKKVDKMIEALYERLCADPTLMPNFYMQVAYHQGMDRAVADYISGMSDEFATRLFEELFVPQKWQVL